MQIEHHRSLRHHNSFGFDVSARYFTEVSSEDDLLDALQWARKQSTPVFILGGGSNIVFTRNVDALVIHLTSAHYTVTDVAPQTVHVTAGAGMVWHTLVQRTLNEGFFGLENMALIPGCAGAAPIQNIGAYGREISDILISVNTVNRVTGEHRVLTCDECDFSYRHSVFKTTAGAELIVTAITLSLSRVDSPAISYQALADAVAAADIKKVSAHHVFDLVCDIRRSKLPDPEQLGNAGSFFKNPIITDRQLDALKAKYADVPYYRQDNQHVKVPAAWLIDRAGWKGFRNPHVGVHERQALVLINHNGGTGQQIAQLADEIKSDIQNRFKVCLEREPVLY
jgi:UDP-N-acetylmuramate dehydrogenase